MKKGNEFLLDRPTGDGTLFYFSLSLSLTLSSSLTILLSYSLLLSLTLSYSLLLSLTLSYSLLLDSDTEKVSQLDDALTGYTACRCISGTVRAWSSADDVTSDTRDQTSDCATWVVSHGSCHTW